MIWRFAAETPPPNRPPRAPPTAMRARGHAAHAYSYQARGRAISTIAPSMSTFGIGSIAVFKRTRATTPASS
jgi:hypothetical protein